MRFFILVALAFMAVGSEAEECTLTERTDASVPSGMGVLFGFSITRGDGKSVGGINMKVTSDEKVKVYLQDYDDAESWHGSNFAGDAVYKVPFKCSTETTVCARSVDKDTGFKNGKYSVTVINAGSEDATLQIKVFCDGLNCNCKKASFGTKLNVGMWGGALSLLLSLSFLLRGQ